MNNCFFVNGGYEETGAISVKMIITAGGTSEPIDRVRSIGNISTGRLGSLIAKAFALRNDIEKIYYVCGRTAVLPPPEKTEIRYVDDVASLETAIRQILGQDSVDIIVHGMAVSDYRVKGTTSAAMIAKTFTERPKPPASMNEREAESFFASLLEASDTVAGSNGKISSHIDHMVLVMERTPKIISLFQTLSPKAVLVGFKLLDHVPQDVLIDTAYAVLKENRCRFVLANDLRDIDQQRHIGYLIRDDKSYKRCVSKEEIAEAIADAAIGQKRSGLK
jgi:phosphopantothenate-cysteine ligase